VDDILMGVNSLTAQGCTDAKQQAASNAPGASIIVPDLTK
jgi:hypothetical protein